VYFSSSVIREKNNFVLHPKYQQGVRADCNSASYLTLPGLQNSMVICTRLLCTNINFTTALLALFNVKHKAEGDRQLETPE
jgi:hypothetical protein